MAQKKKRQAKRSGSGGGAASLGGSLNFDLTELRAGGGLEDDGAQAGTTGRYIVTFADQSPASMKAAIATMHDRAGISDVCFASDFSTEEFDASEADGADAIVLEELGIAVVSSAPERALAFDTMMAETTQNMIVEPEHMNFAIGLDPVETALEEDEDTDTDSGDLLTVSTEFLKGYQRGVAELVDSLSEEAAAEVRAAHTRDTGTLTWGLQATGIGRTRLTGRGVRVAVLDTGLDLNHPDFANRRIISASFIAGESAQDGNGHGTHTIGTACGSATPGMGPRYGIASEAEIFAGKVLSNAGSGSDGSILAGINWALRNGCRVISMSLGRRVRVGEPPMRAYETAAFRGLRAGTLILAAAGNDSRRPFQTLPVSSPANCPSIAAVAALDSRLRIASFSNAGINSNGGEINLAGPGKDVLSSWPMPTRVRSISGTSMATPHAAGIAALVAQTLRGGTGVDLFRAIARLTRSLPLPRRDAGHGLIQAPRS